MSTILKDFQDTSLITSVAGGSSLGRVPLRCCRRTRTGKIYRYFTFRRNAQGHGGCFRCGLGDN
jgi:hypothetical protein